MVGAKGDQKETLWVPLLWMDKILHHFETVVETITFVGFLGAGGSSQNRGVSDFGQSARRAFDFATISGIAYPTVDGRNPFRTTQQSLG